jgi:hypothetical protein
LQYFPVLSSFVQSSKTLVQVLHAAVDPSSLGAFSSCDSSKHSTVVKLGSINKNKALAAAVVLWDIVPEVLQYWCGLEHCL